MDERPGRLIEKADLPAATKRRLLDLISRADALVTEAGKEAKPEFGPAHVALIVGCNQFLRIRRSGGDAGHVELWIQDETKSALSAAGFTLHPPEGVVFQMFGWVRIDPMEGDLDALEAGLDAAVHRAITTGAPTL